MPRHLETSEFAAARSLVDVSWMEHGRCVGTDPSVFYPDGGAFTAKHTAAKKLCADCPVIADCRAYALEWEDFGTWAGMTEAELRREKRRIAGKPPRVPNRKRDEAVAERRRRHLQVVAS